jgi:hypothetical protein
MKIPSVITAGDSLSWDDDPTSDNLGNPIDSSLWTLKYDFRQASVSNLSVTAAAHGSGWRTSLTALQSAAWAAGKLYWIAYATKALERVTLGSGQIDVSPNIVAAANTVDLRSQTQQDLDAIDAAIRAIIAGGAVAEYTIGGRSLRKTPMADLIQLRNVLKSRLFREQKAQRIANGLGNPSNVFVRFSN